MRRLTVTWPSGETQVFTDVPVDTRYRLTEGGALETRAAGARQRSADASTPDAGDARPDPARRPVRRAAATATLDAPKPGAGARRSTAARPAHGADSTHDAVARRPAGRPSLLLFWRSDVAAARARWRRTRRWARPLEAARIGVLAIALDDAAEAARGAGRGARRRAGGARHAGAGLLWAIVHRHLFMNRQAMPLPTALLLDGAGRIVRAYRERIDAGAGRAGRRGNRRRRRPSGWRGPCRSPGSFHAPLSPRNFLPYGRELLDEGLEAEAIVAFERASQASPSASVLYRLGHAADARRAGAAGARRVRRRAGARSVARRSPQRSRHAAGAGWRPRRRDRAVPAGAGRDARVPDALNNLGYALLLTGRDAEARPLYERALALQPDFPEALNNLGLLLGRAAISTAPSGTSARRWRAGPTTAMPPTTSRSCWWRAAQADEAVALLEDVPAARPRLRERLRDAGEDPSRRRPDRRRVCGPSSDCCSAIPRTSRAGTGARVPPA